MGFSAASHDAQSSPSRRVGAGAWLPDISRSVENLMMHKLRSLLTMLGMIFGVAAVLSMLSIGAGAQQQVMAFIEDLGVRNLIVEAREATDWQQLQKIRQQSPGLTFHDVRAIQATVDGVDVLTARKRFTPRTEEKEFCIDRAQTSHLGACRHTS